MNKAVRRIAVVGTGVIGASWSAQYLARGFDVVATDPAPNAEANLREYVDDAWRVLTRIGLSPGASRDRLSFTADMNAALSNADFVQENSPERPDFKIKLYADMDAVTPTDSLIASSSSSLTMSVIQSKCAHRERCVIGHPFNPPHIIPLVEVVGGAKTSPEAVQRAMAFYTSIGKKAIHFMSAGLWPALGSPTVTPQLQKTLIEGVQQQAGNRSVQELADSENEVLVGLLHLRAQHA
jgi:carnitine 3-dehydrogenase